MKERPEAGAKEEEALRGQSSTWLQGGEPIYYFFKMPRSGKAWPSSTQADTDGEQDWVLAGGSLHSPGRAVLRS